MAGEIREKIDSFIERQAGADTMLQKIIEAYMMLNGFNPHEYTLESDDDPATMDKLETMLDEIESIMSFSVSSLPDGNQDSIELG